MLIKLIFSHFLSSHGNLQSIYRSLAACCQVSTHSLSTVTITTASLLTQALDNMILNKTVYLMNGSTKVCEYNTEDVQLSALWTTIYSLTLALNIFAVIGNAVVILACCLQKQKTPLVIFVLALAVSDLCTALIAPFSTIL